MEVFPEELHQLEDSLCIGEEIPTPRDHFFLESWNPKFTLVWSAVCVCCWEQVGGSIMAGCGRRSAQSRRYEQNRKIKKFVKGLKPSLKARLLELYPHCLEEVLGVPNKQENKMESYQGEKEAQNEGVPKPFQRQDRKKKKLMEGQQSTVASGSEKPECIHCRKCHGGNACWRKEGRCLRCGSKDHRLRECPNLKTKFISRDVSSTAIKEQGLAGDDFGDVTTVGGQDLDANCQDCYWRPHPWTPIHSGRPPPGRQPPVGGQPLDVNYAVDYNRC
ncbi:hypothetical protein Taro_000321 [Colocasia esculenta]|uniref:CCHC-type domain-containing protein n=1 Tax=Colocasia esculenta TaxID=4460 RepID=A0A843TEF7_COLES|nr:hypothetical protein [Colocasia esculenta]